MVYGFVFLLAALVFLGFSLRNGPLRFGRWADTNGKQRRCGGWDLIVGLLMAVVAVTSFLRH